MKKSKIEVNVELDTNNVPEKLHWSAEDGQINNQEAKAVFLSIWDPKNRESLKIDLWTKDMPLEDMKLFFYQTFLTMSDTFQTSIQDERMTETIKDFCDYFAEKMEIAK